ncbi:MAG: transporter substrate-binding domain-containing protein [Burkholderiales bacterium]|jgi:polar amino acid transport system substrate-binding protein|nr:transporter substrate-binding domain-containing protein [Burkholderiales bacterium]
MRFTLFALKAVRHPAALCCLLWLGLVTASASDVEPLRIGRGGGGMTSILADSTVAVLQAAYAKLGVEIRFEEYPLLRSLAFANAGTIDGDMMRIAETSERYPNLIRVDVPVNYLEITVYARAPCPVIKSWDDLRGKQVAHLRGVLAIERRVKEADRVPVETQQELFRMLNLGMVDLVLGTGVEADVSLRLSGEKGLCRVDGVLERVPLYHYLHKRHAALAQRLQAQLQSMQQRGEIDTILRRELARRVGR